MEHICWSRVGSAAGEEPGEIINRKECERRALKGIFFWQVGNKPPVKEIRVLGAAETPVQVVFSALKGKSKTKDKSPKQVFVWQSYYDYCRREIKPLPDGALVTSRGMGCNHSYALVCESEKPLTVWAQGGKDSFNPNLLNREIACQHVTAFFKKDECYRNTKKPDWMRGYRKEMEAALVQKCGYWVLLQDPKVFDGNEWEKRIEQIKEESQRYQRQKWLELVHKIRSD